MGLTTRKHIAFEYHLLLDSICIAALVRLVILINIILESQTFTTDD